MKLILWFKELDLVSKVNCVTVMIAVPLAILASFFPNVVDQNTMHSFLISFIAFESLLISLYYLPKIVDIVKQRRKCTIDDVFEPFDNYFNESTWSVTNELFIGSVFVSGLLMCSHKVRELSAAGVKIKVLLSDYEGDCMPAVVKIMGGGSKRVTSKLLSSYESLQANFSGIKNLEVRKIDYAFTYGFLAIDSEKKEGYINIQLFGFDNVNLPQKANFKCHNDSKWFPYYTDQINALWEKAVPVHLTDDGSIAAE